MWGSSNPTNTLEPVPLPHNLSGTSTTTTTYTLNAIGTLTSTTFVDGVAVMTNTLIGSSTNDAGRTIFTKSFPSETYGEVAYTLMTAVLATGTGRCPADLQTMEPQLPSPE